MSDPINRRTQVIFVVGVILVIALAAAIGSSPAVLGAIGALVLIGLGRDAPERYVMPLLRIGTMLAMVVLYFTTRDGADSMWGIILPVGYAILWGIQALRRK